MGLYRVYIKAPKGDSKKATIMKRRVEVARRQGRWIPTRKIIEGRAYYSARNSTHGWKADANQSARQWRKRGYNARVVEVSSRQYSKDIKSWRANYQKRRKREGRG